MPINELQLTILLLKFGISIGCDFIAVLFFLKIKKTRKTGVEISPFLGFALAILLFGLMHIIYLYYDFFQWDSGIQSVILYKAANIVGSCGITGLVFLAEKMLHKTKFIFTIIYILCAFYGIFFLSIISDLRLLFTIINILSAPIIFTSFLISMILKTKGEIRRKMGVAFVCYFGFLFSYLLGSESFYTFINLPGEPAMIISYVGQFFTLMIWGVMFLGFETFTEFGWKEKIKELFIIAPNGITLIHYKFQDLTPIHSPDLFSAGITGVKDILAEMVQSKQTLKIVDHQDVKVIFEYGNYSTLALVAYENLRIYQSKLAILSQQFENLFQDVLSEWNGETEVFIPSKRLIAEILQ